MLSSCRAGAVFMVAVVLAGCTQEDGPLSPEGDLTPWPDAAQAALVCQVDVRAGSMECIPESPSLPEGVAGAVLGGQDKYVMLESSNVTVQFVRDARSPQIHTHDFVLRCDPLLGTRFRNSAE